MAVFSFSDLELGSNHDKPTLAIPVRRAIGYGCDMFGAGELGSRPTEARL